MKNVEIAFVNHAPEPVAHPARRSRAQVEEILAEWFGADVVLTSSGRAAMMLFMTAVGMNRYRHRIEMPRMISACVFDAVIRRGFPIDAASRSPADMTVLYHQYGIPQRYRPERTTLEDISHAFFANPRTGERAWVGEAASFSLPKFFPTAGMIGGLVVKKPGLAAELRSLRDAAPETTEEERAELGRVYRTRRGPDAVYLTRLLNPRIFDDETGGTPGSVAEIRAVGARRQEMFCRILEGVATAALPEGWRSLLSSALPFALPIFGEEGRLARADQELIKLGVSAGLFQIDRNRDMSKPDLSTALLLPCHEHISLCLADQMAEILRAACSP